MLEKIKGLKWAYVLIGALLGVVGFCLLLLNNSLSALAITIGILLSLFGVGFGVVAVASHKRGIGFVIKIIFAVICLAAGVTVAILNESAVDALIAILCLLIIVDGSFKLSIAITSKRHSVSGWWIMTLASALVIVSAFILARYTPEITTATTLLGLILIADAAINLLSSVWVPKCETAARAEIYYEVHRELDEKAED